MMHIETKEISDWHSLNVLFCGLQLTLEGPKSCYRNNICHKITSSLAQMIFNAI